MRDMFFRRNKCRHVYNETRIEKYDIITGGHRLFICEYCQHRKYIHIPHIRQIIIEQEEYLKNDIDIKYVYIRNKELEKEDHYRKKTLKY